MPQAPLSPTRYWDFRAITLLIPLLHLALLELGLRIAGYGHPTGFFVETNERLKSDGTLFAWGGSPAYNATLPAGLSNVVAIAAGSDFCLAITTNQAVADRFRGTPTE